MQIISVYLVSQRVGFKIISLFRSVEQRTSKLKKNSKVLISGLPYCYSTEDKVASSFSCQHENNRDMRYMYNTSFVDQDYIYIMYI